MTARSRRHLLDIRQQRLVVRIAADGLGLEHPHNDLRHRLRAARRHLCERPRRPQEPPLHHLHRVGPLEGRHPGNGVIERCAQRIDVRAQVHLLLTQRLGGDVVGRAPDLVVRGGLRPGERGDAKVGQLRLVRLVDKNVLGLHIAMDQALLGGGAQPLGNLPPHVQHRQRVHRPIVHQPVERTRLHQLHYQIGLRGHLAKGVDPHDVRAIELGRGLRLVPETLDEGGILGRLLAQDDLHRHLALQPVIEALVDRAHPAGTNQPHQPVLPQLPWHHHLRPARRARHLRKRLLAPAKGRATRRADRPRQRLRFNSRLAHLLCSFTLGVALAQ